MVMVNTCNSKTIFRGYFPSDRSFTLESRFACLVLIKKAGWQEVSTFRKIYAGKIAGIQWMSVSGGDGFGESAARYEKSGAWCADGARWRLF